MEEHRKRTHFSYTSNINTETTRTTAVRLHCSARMHQMNACMLVFFFYYCILLIIHPIHYVRPSVFSPFLLISLDSNLALRASPLLLHVRASNFSRDQIPGLCVPSSNIVELCLPVALSTV